MYLDYYMWLNLPVSTAVQCNYNQLSLLSKYFKIKEVWTHISSNQQMNRATTVLIENACLEKRNFFFMHNTASFWASRVLHYI